MAEQLTPEETTPEIDDPIEWIESEFYIPELAGPIQLMPYQRAVLREAYRRDNRGHFVYSVVVWCDIKKSGKSSIAAATALERARRITYGSVKIVANDLKQADSRVSHYARRAIDLNPRLRDRVKSSPSGYRIRFPNQAVVESIPVDPRGEAGGNDDLIIFSELWGMKNRAAQQMWTEMTLSPTKMGYSQRWIETYAGYEGESPILERLYEQGVKQGELLDLGIPGLEIFANHEARLLCLWNTVPRCTWQTPEYYAQERSTLLPQEYARVHENQWGSSVERFVPIEWWDSCRNDEVVAAAANPVVVALDAAVSGDSFSVVTVTRQVDREVDPPVALIVVKEVRVWYPPKGGKIDYADVEQYVRGLRQRYNVREFTYDPYQLHDMSQRLYGRVGYWEEFKQGEDRLKADKQLYDLIRDGRIVHNGDPELREHIRNANAKAENERLRIVKRSQEQKIDSAVALSMAAERAIYYSIGG